MFLLSLKYQSLFVRVEYEPVALQLRPITGADPRNNQMKRTRSEKKKKNSFFLSRDFPSMFPCRLTERHAPRGLVCCTKELKEKARGDFSMARVVFSTRQRMCTLLLIRSLFYIEYVSSENKKPPYSRGWKRRCGLPRHLSCLPPLCMKLTVCRAPYLE